MPSSLRQSSSRPGPNMFSTLGLFRSLACPEKDKCTRVPCIFSHRTDLPPPFALDITVHLPTQARPSTAPTPPQPQPQQRLSLTPAKRPVPHTPIGNDSTILSVAAEPPRKLQKVGSAQRPLAIPTASHREVRLARTFKMNNTNDCRRLEYLFSEFFLRNRWFRFPFARQAFHLKSYIVSSV